MKELDLHGVKHEDAKNEVIRLIEANWNTGTTIKIITGHSPQMKALVKSVLGEYDLEYEIGGLFGMNPGIMTAELP